MWSAFDPSSGRALPLRYGRKFPYSRAKKPLKWDAVVKIGRGRQACGLPLVVGLDLHRHVQPLDRPDAHGFVKG